MSATVAQVAFVVIVAVATLVLVLAFRQAGETDRRERELSGEVLDDLRRRARDVGVS